MKKRLITIFAALTLVAFIGVVLANNKAKIDAAAMPEVYHSVIPVKVQDARMDSFSTSFQINGSTIPVKEVKIASEVQGKLVSLYVDNGDFVRAGQVIAALDASVFQVQLKSIEASIAKAELDLARYNKLIEMGGATPMQAESAQLQINSLVAEKKQVLEQISHMQIRAPFKGKVENVTAELGSFVSYGTVLCQLIDNSSLKIDVYLSEQEAFKVKLNQPVDISTVVLDTPKKGKITMISDKADASGKFLTEISFSNTDKDKLKAGMLTDVLFSDKETITGISVPVSALVAGAKDARVFVVTDGKAKLREIKTGIITQTRVEVTEGLKEGEQVIISGQLNLENGTPVSVNW